MNRILLVIILSLAGIKSFSQTNNSSTMDSLKSYNKSLYPFESKWMEIDGNKIHYIDEGDGQTYEFTFVQQAKVFQYFISRLQLSEIILLGHDNPSGLLVAAWQPELFKGFVLTDTQIFPSDEYKRIHRLLNMAGGRFFSSFNTATNFLTWGTMKFGMPTKKFTKAEKQEYYKMSKGKMRRQAPGKILKSIRTEREAMVQVRTAFETNLSQKPVLMIYGVNDPVNQLGIPERMKKMLPNSELHLIEGEKHFPHEGQAKLMSLIMYKWLRKKGF